MPPANRRQPVGDYRGLPFFEQSASSAQDKRRGECILHAPDAAAYMKGRAAELKTKPPQQLGQGIGAPSGSRPTCLVCRSEGPIPVQGTREAGRCFATCARTA